MRSSNFPWMSGLVVLAGLALPVLWLLPNLSGVLLLVWAAVLILGMQLMLARRQHAQALNKALDALRDKDALDLSLRCAGQDQAAQALDGFLQRADQQMQALAGTASRLVPMARELADGYMDSHQKSQMQKQYGNAVASSVHELEAMRVQVHEQNQHIGSAVGSAVDAAQASMQTIDRTAHSMDNLAESTDQAAQQIDVLTNVNHEIMAIAQTITEIAESTNLLALNAAIEAARAGEHGRGFAVVADEVRRLSSQTQEATANIRELADSVGTESERTVERIRNTRDRALETRQQMQSATEEITRIDGAVEQIKELSDAITAQMQQQQQVAESAAQTVSALVALNESVVSGGQSSQVTESDLLTLADELRSKIAAFHTSGQSAADSGPVDQPADQSADALPSHPAKTAPSAAGVASDTVELF